jgi:transposase
MTERERIRVQIRAHVKGHPELQRNVTLLMSIPGIAEFTAWTILTELPDVQQFDLAQAVAAYASLAPREHRSGRSVYKKTRLGKHGNSRLCTTMYFPAISAVIWNPLVKAQYEHLRQAGKAKMVALAAAMRKLVMICYRVSKYQQPFQATGGSCPRSLKPPRTPLTSLAA